MISFPEFGRLYNSRWDFIYLRNLRSLVSTFLELHVAVKKSGYGLRFSHGLHCPSRMLSALFFPLGVLNIFSTSCWSLSAFPGTHGTPPLWHHVLGDILESLAELCPLFLSIRPKAPFIWMLDHQDYTAFHYSASCNSYLFLRSWETASVYFANFIGFNISVTLLFISGGSFPGFLLLPPLPFPTAPPSPPHSPFFSSSSSSSWAMGMEPRVLHILDQCSTTMPHPAPWMFFIFYFVHVQACVEDTVVTFL